jgi:hypothetical protein
VTAESTGRIDVTKVTLGPTIRHTRLSTTCGTPGGGVAARPEPPGRVHRRDRGPADEIAPAQLVQSCAAPPRHGFPHRLRHSRSGCVPPQRCVLLQLCFAADCRLAASGRLDSAAWLSAPIATLPQRLPTTAAMRATAALFRCHVEVLRWARENGCEWDARTCAWAAGGGHLDVLRWARENGCPERDDSDDH